MTGYRSQIQFKILALIGRCSRKKNIYIYIYNSLYILPLIYSYLITIL